MPNTLTIFPPFIQFFCVLLIANTSTQHIQFYLLSCKTFHNFFCFLLLLLYASLKEAITTTKYRFMLEKNCIHNKPNNLYTLRKVDFSSMKKQPKWPIHHMRICYLHFSFHIKALARSTTKTTL